MSQRSMMRLISTILLLAVAPIGASAQQSKRPAPASAPPETVSAPAQSELMSVDDLLTAAQDWAKENLDDDALNLLADVDRDRIRAFLVEFENRMQTNSVYELGGLRENAKEIVPFLEQWEETLPLAEWLKTRLDYLDVSEELRRGARPAEKAPPPTVPVPTPAPKPQTPLPTPKAGPRLLEPPTLPVERAVWRRQFEKRAVPAKAQAYVPRLKEIFIAERTPPELVWVAEVESSFNPDARSPVGAAGLFQLMKPTAKTYGLSTFFPDERTDPEKNARAAARYLRYLHGRFGDWPLALAAYNAGEGRIENLLKAAGKRDYSAIANRLPAETQMYVPKCEAAVQKREGVTLADLRNPSG